MSVKVIFECENSSQILDEMAVFVGAMLASNGYDVKAKPLDDHTKDIDDELAKRAGAWWTPGGGEPITMAQVEAQQHAEPVSPVAEAFTQPPTAPAEQPAVQSAALPTTSAPQFTREELMTAAAPLMDAGKLEELSALTKQLGVESLTDLPESKFNDFATGIRNLGARI